MKIIKVLTILIALTLFSVNLHAQSVSGSVYFNNHGDRHVIIHGSSHNHNIHWHHHHHHHWRHHHHPHRHFRSTVRTVPPFRTICSEPWRGSGFHHSSCFVTTPPPSVHMFCEHGNLIKSELIISVVVDIGYEKP